MNKKKRNDYIDLLIISLPFLVASVFITDPTTKNYFWLIILIAFLLGPTHKYFSIVYALLLILGVLAVNVSADVKFTLSFLLLLPFIIDVIIGKD